MSVAVNNPRSQTTIVIGVFGAVSHGQALVAGARLPVNIAMRMWTQSGTDNEFTNVETMSVRLAQATGLLDTLDIPRPFGDGNVCVQNGFSPTTPGATTRAS